MPQPKPHPQPTNTCRTCKFYQPFARVSKVEEATYGQCLRFPPQRIAGHQSGLETENWLQPFVLYYDICGEHLSGDPIAERLTDAELIDAAPK